MSVRIGAVTACVLAAGLSACAYNRNEQLPFASATQSNLSRLLGVIPIISPNIGDAMHGVHQQANDEGKAIALVNVRKIVLQCRQDRVSR